ncbi:MAG: lytic transglycosylase domain-containing protein [Terriglobia bacterium]
MHSHNGPAVIRIVLVCLLYCLSAPLLRGEHIVAISGPNGRPVFVNTGGEPLTASGRRPANGASQPALSLTRIVQRTAGKFRVDPKLVDAVIKVESQYNPRAISPKGAIGLMQLIPATAERFGVQNPFNPRQNVQGGVGYLRYLLDLFKGNIPLSLAAYNAGEHTVLRDGAVPQIPETVNYVRKVTSLYRSGLEGAVAPELTPAVHDVPVYRYVDRHGVMHFTNDGGY